MSDLFKSAVQSIVLGLEDYQTNAPECALSAVRNLYAGVLLLGKEVLIRKVPNANADVLLAARFKLMPDGGGGITFVPNGNQTVDFDELGRRLKDFNGIDLKDMRRLKEIRNDVEHRATDQPPLALREHVAAVFPTVVQLFRHIGEEPGEALGESWQVILQVRHIYEAQAKECQGTVKAIKWAKSLMGELELRCPRCDSILVEQLDATNTDPLSMRCSCRACASELDDPEEVIEATLNSHFDVDIYIAAKDGGDEPLVMCPECGRDAYLWGSEDDGCAVCGAILGNCAFCEEPLSPWSVSGDDETLCSYCYFNIHKDD